MMSSKISKSLTLIFLCLAIVGCEKPKDKEARYLARGNALFEQGEYAKARLEYRNAEQIMPTDAEPRYRLGLVDEAEGDPRNAFANFMGAEQQNSHYHPALLKLANYLLAVGEFEQANHRLSIVLGETPDDAEGHALRAAILLRQKDFDGTEKEARLALAKDAGNVTAVSVLTGLYSAQHSEPKAVAALDDGIAHNPNNLSLLLLKVMLYEQTSNLDKIAEAYQAVFKMKPREEAFRNDLAKLYVKSGKIGEAETTLRDGVAAMPDDWAMKKDLVFFLGESRSLEMAEKEIQNLMQANPKKDELYFWLADLYISHKATDRAVALLEKIVARDDSDHSSLNARTSLARIHFVKGDRGLAEKLVAAVLEKDRGNHDALFIRAHMAYDMGRYQEAVSDARSIIRDDPHAKEALQLLAETLLLQGHLDLAIDTQNQLVDVESANMQALVRLAQLNVLNGNTRRAMELLAVVTKTAPDYAIGWESTARAAINAKDWATSDSAIATLDALPGQHALAVFLKAQSLNALGKKEEAIPLYVQVFSADPSAPLSEHALAAFVEAKQGLNRLQEAADTLRSLKTDSSVVSTLLGGCLAKLGKTDEAAAAFDKAIAANATSQNPYLGRADIFLRQRKLKEALSVLEKARQTVPADIRASMLAAVVMQELGRVPEAIALYDAMLVQNPQLDEAANNLAQAIADYQYNDSASMEKARRAAERFVGSPNPLYQDTLGWVYFRQGDLPQAQTVMERVMASKSDLPPEVHYHYGSLLLKLGKTAEAKAELKLATASGAEYSSLDKAKEILGGL
jgi:tetratricopeptide (TPR) repeat protein